MGERNVEIDMISVCLADGSLQPLRFRYEDPAHQLHRVTITEILCCKEVQYVGIEALLYTCRCLDGPQERLFELRYTIRTHRWVIFRQLY